MNQEREVVDYLQREERKRLLQNPPQPLRPPEAATIHYSELPEGTKGGRLATEWNFYRNQVSRLLSEGHEGRWVLIKGEEILGIFDTEQEADQVRVQNFPMHDVLVKQIREREPVMRCGAYFRPWPS